MTTRTKTIRITLGELIRTVWDEARRVTHDELNAYRLTGLIVNRMLQPLAVPATRRTCQSKRRVH